MHAVVSDELLERLCSGDSQAAEQVFRVYEPYLRQVVRRQLSAALRAKFDSADIVQSVWADLLRGFGKSSWHFASASDLRTFLLTAVRHRLIDRRRRCQNALEHEEPLREEASGTALFCDEPRPSEAAQADDLWQRMLALCPPVHHSVLLLRRQGLSFVEIAERTGLHEGSIRRIFRQLARQLSCAEGPVGAPMNRGPGNPSAGGTPETLP